jgi:apolipoprotein N-acyltransferase
MATVLAKQPTRVKILIAFVSGILMGLAPAPINAWFLAWIALVPLWVLVVTEAKRKNSPCSPPLLLSLTWGIGYHGVALSWITGLHPLTWMGVPWLGSVAIALFAWLFITLWGAALVMIWAWAIRALERFCLTFRSEATKASKTSHLQVRLAPFVRVLIGTALWCGLESVWELGPLYWTSLSYTQSPSNPVILHLGQISGAMTVTAAIVACNGFFAEAWMSWHETGRREDGEWGSGFSKSFAPRTLLTVAVILFASLHLIGFSLYSRPLADEPSSALKVGIVQGNIPTREKLTANGVQRAIAAYTTGYTTLAEQGVNAVLTPEGAMPFVWAGENRTRNTFYQAILQKKVVAWLGTFVPQGNRLTQSLLTIAGNGEIISRFNKIKLVPLGEYIPFESVLGAIVNRLSPIETGMVPGATHQKFDTPFGQAAVGICYESAYGKLFRAQVATGGEFILTASNLDPYSAVLMAQDQAQGVMRSIETDRWAVRATNTGYSSVVDPHGKIVWRSSPNVYEIHADTIYRRQTQTLYVRWGNWLTPLLLGLSTLSVGLFAVR